MSVQVASVGATAAANVVIARRFGPEGQGFLTQFRANVDVVTAIGLFGFPQAFVYLLNVAREAPAAAIRFSERYVIAFFVVLAIAAGLLSWAHFRPIDTLGPQATKALVLAASLMLLHGLYRSVVLPTKSVVVFNAVSAAPALATLGVYLLWRAHDVEPLVYATVVAGGAAAGVGFCVLWPNRSRKNRGLKPGNLRELLSYSFWSFIPGVTATFLPAATYFLLKHVDPTDSLAGEFSVSVLFFNAIALPLNMVAPVLFDAWSKRSDSQDARDSQVGLAHVSVMLVLLVILPAGLLGIPFATRVLFGAKFLPSISSTRVFLFAALASTQSRVLAPALLAAGRPQVVAWGNLCRAVIPIATMALFVRQENALSVTAMAWATGDATCAAIFIFSTARLRNMSIAVAAGVSPQWFRAQWRQLLQSRRAAVPGRDDEGN